MNKTVHGTRRQAQQALTKMLASRDEGKLHQPSRDSLNAYLDRWLEVAAKPRLRPRTYKEYKALLERYIRPELGEVALGKITVLDVQEVYSRMQASGLSSRTIEYTHAVLRSALRQAVKWEVIPTSPTDGVELPKEDTFTAHGAGNESTNVLRVLDRDQTRTFLSACETHRYGALLGLAITAGLRPSEYLALQWSDINFEDGTVVVQRTIAHIDGEWKYHPPKTRRSRRVVKLLSPIVEALLDQRELQNKQREKAGDKWEDRGLVFTTRTGGPLMLRNVRRSFKQLLFDLDLPNIRLYDLRHVAATQALIAGIPVKVISEQLGHASTAFTMDVYSHVLPHMQTEAAQLMEAHLWSEENVNTLDGDAKGELAPEDCASGRPAHIWHTNAKTGHPSLDDPSPQSPF